MSGGLGMERHTVAVAPRGGGPGIPLKVISGQAARKKDDTSAASVVLAASAECCGIVDQIGPLSHELQITRGDDTEPWWEGPLCSIEQDLTNGTIRLNAKDLSKWFDLRVLHQDHEWVDADLSQVYLDLINDALFGGPIADNPNIIFAIDPSGVLYTGTAESRVRQATGQLLRSLGARGIDWSMIGRCFVARRHTKEPKPGFTLDRDSFITPPKLRRSEASYGSFYYVLGSTGVSGFGGGYEPFYGLVERVEADTTIGSTFDADQRADSLAAESSVGSFIDPNATSTLSPAAKLDFDTDLIPGCVFRVDLPGCPDTVESMRLCEVRVRWSPTEEQVQVGLQPIAGSESAIVDSFG